MSIVAGMNGKSHFRTRDAKRRIGEQIYRQVYSGAPMPFLIMTPEFEIVDANDAYLRATMRQRDSLAGLEMFQAFPDNPELAEADGVANLKQSLLAARSSGARQKMGVQRYDVTDPKGNWRTRYWRPVNWPVLDDKGSILALVHHVVDVTPDVLAHEAVQSTDILFKRAEAACNQAHQLKEEVRRQLDWAIRVLPTRRRP